MPEPPLLLPPPPPPPLRAIAGEFTHYGNRDQCDESIGTHGTPSIHTPLHFNDATKTAPGDLSPPILLSFAYHRWRLRFFAFTKYSAHPTFSLGRKFPSRQSASSADRGDSQRRKRTCRLPVLSKRAVTDGRVLGAASDQNSSAQWREAIVLATPAGITTAN